MRTATYRRKRTGDGATVVAALVCSLVLLVFGCGRSGSEQASAGRADEAVRQKAAVHVPDDLTRYSFSVMPLEEARTGQDVSSTDLWRKPLVAWGSIKLAADVEYLFGVGRDATAAFRQRPLTGAHHERMFICF